MIVWYGDYTGSSWLLLVTVASGAAADAGLNKLDKQ